MQSQRYNYNDRLIICKSCTRACATDLTHLLDEALSHDVQSDICGQKMRRNPKSRTLCSSADGPKDRDVHGTLVTRRSVCLLKLLYMRQHDVIQTVRGIELLCLESLSCASAVGEQKAEHRAEDCNLQLQGEDHSCKPRASFESLMRATFSFPRSLVERLWTLRWREQRVQWSAATSLPKGHDAATVDAFLQLVGCSQKRLSRTVAPAALALVEAMQNW